jgi:hypothetical protein
MGHGTPDWKEAAPKETTYALTDLAELAARLGSIDTFERGGEVIFLTDFGCGTALVTTWAYGTLAEVYPIASGGLSHPISLVLKTGNEAGDASGIDKYLYYPVPGGVGAEISFRRTTGLREVILGMLLYDGTNYTLGQIKYDHVNGLVQIWKTESEWQTVGSPGVQTEAYPIYYTLKAVIDTATGTYVRVLFNRHVYDASAYSPPVSVDVTKPCLIVRVFAYTDLASSIAVQIANLIITQNERV